MQTQFPRFVPCGDRALLIYLGDEIDPGLNGRVHALARALKRTRHPAIIDVSPSYHAVLVEFDPVRIVIETIMEMAHTVLTDHLHAEASDEIVEVPVAYGGQFGPDLDAVSAHTGLSQEEIIALHAKTLYRVYCLGFSPGFAYLGGLDQRIHTPRLAEPRVRVPAGSVGIGGSQTGAYPSETPGGWQLIGQTPQVLFDPYREQPTMLEPGQQVKFVPISAAEYAEMQATALRGRPSLPPEIQGRPGVRILQPGLQTTIQDLGRRGYLTYGVPTSGAADFVALMVGNWLMSNRARTSALEITMVGPELEFTGPTAFCLTGAPVPAELIPADGGSPRRVDGWTALLAWPGDRLRIGSVQQGCRAYLCVAGGFDLPPVLGSLSEDLFAKVGPVGRPLASGDWLPLGLPLQPPAALAGRSVPTDALPDYGQKVTTVRAVRGPQAAAFSDEALQALFTAQYTVGAQSDRQGLRLDGPAIMPHTPDILSEPIPSGSIQVPGNGQPILLLTNRQTMGGYPKPAVAVYSDLTMAGQLKPGDTLRFQEVDLSEAIGVARAERRKLAQIRRYLERSHVATQVSIPKPETIEVAHPAEPLPVHAEQSEPTAAAPTRHFKISIGDITFDAEVEEVSDN